MIETSGSQRWNSYTTRDSKKDWTFLLIKLYSKKHSKSRQKRNKKKNTTSRRNETDIKKRCTRKPRTRISKETMNILGRQE